MVADLTHAEAKAMEDEGCGRGLEDELGHEWRETLEADKLDHKSFGMVQFVLEFAEAAVHPAGASGGWVSWERVWVGLTRTLM